VTCNQAEKGRPNNEQPTDTLCVRRGLFCFQRQDFSSKDRAAGDHRHNKQHQEHEEQNSGEFRSCSRDAAESECRCNHSYQKKNECVIEHCLMSSKVDAEWFSNDYATDNASECGGA
jgi:hypothetical protein